MVYKVFDKTLVMRLNRGDEVLSSIETACKKENIKSASVQAIGAADYVEVGVYIVPEKKYIKNTFEGDMEITNISGNVTTKNGEFYLHLHGTFGKENGDCVGGHLNKVVISGTCEIFIEIIDGIIERVVDDETGLNVLEF